MSFVIICKGLVGGSILGGPDVEGCYLKSFDVDAHEGRGFSEWTRDPAEAEVFADAVAAHACWTRTSSVQPIREDGQANRPLTAFTVEIRRLP